MAVNTFYDFSLVVALVLMLFFAVYFLTAKTLDKPVFANYIRSRRIMGGVMLVLSANYMVHLLCKPRFSHTDAAILMNLSTYFLAYWLFYSAFMTLLDRARVTRRRSVCNMLCWMLFTAMSAVVVLFFPEGPACHVGLLLMALLLVGYGIHLSMQVISTYRRAVRLFDETHSENIAAYIRWMSIFTWLALGFGVGCGFLTFLPERWCFLWILSSIPFYIYLYCSYMNYMLFYEQVEAILENIVPESSDGIDESGSAEDAANNIPAYHAEIEKRLSEWISERGYIRQGLTIEDVANALSTNRTYLSSYIKATYRVSFREWIGDLRIEYAKDRLLSHPELTVAAVSEESGFMSLSYFTKIFTQKVGTSPSKWRKKC